MRPRRLGKHYMNPKPIPSSELRHELEQAIRSHSASLASHYKEHFESWLQWRIHQEDYQERAMKTLALAVDYQKSVHMLDVGCGLGGYVVAARKLGYEACGLDADDAYVQIAQLRARLHGMPADIFTHAFAESLPFPNEQFDLVHSHDMLEHCQNPEQSLREMYRVLKPGGLVLMTFINRYAFQDPHYHLPGINWLPRKLGAWIARTVTKKNNSVQHDNQELDAMHYFTPWQAAALVLRVGYSGYTNMRRIILREKVRTWGAQHNVSIPEQAITFFTFFAAGYDYLTNQNFYWLLKK